MRNPLAHMYLPKAPPAWMVAAVVILTLLATLLLALVVLYAQKYQTQPRIHLFQDMDNQVKLKAQHASAVFADGRAMRPPVPGTVSRAGLQDDDFFYRGFKVTLNADGQPTPDYFNGYPEQVTVDAFFLQRGREVYDAKCYVCHGKAGYGDGPVNRRAQELALSGNANISLGTVWTPSQNLQKLDEATGQLTYGEDLYPNGKMFQVITHGLGAMSGYGTMIPTADRWAVVAYVRALQLSQHPDLATAAADAAKHAPPATPAAMTSVAELARP